MPEQISTVAPQLTMLDAPDEVSQTSTGQSAPTVNGAQLRATVDKPQNDLPKQSVLVPEIGLDEFGPSLMALSKIDGLGRKGINALYDHIDGHLQKVWQLEAKAIREVLHQKKIPNADNIASRICSESARLREIGSREVAELATRGIRVIPQWDLPDRLMLMPGPPRWLFVQGNPNVLFNDIHIAVVGTREPTPQGLRAASLITRILAPYPVTVVSGLADGIDAQAHITSLQFGLPNVAFLGHGINIVFPRETADIRSHIVTSGGAVVSEYLPDDSYRKSLFVERNRLQAALADLVIPVEAKSTSGTAHTVRFAKDFTRSLVGIDLDIPNEIAGDLGKGAPMIEIFTEYGKTRLDQIVRDKVKRAGLPVYGLRYLQQLAIREIHQRATTVTDLKTFIEALQNEIRTLHGGNDA